MVDWLSARWRANERLRFLAIGGWNTLFGYACFLGLYWLLHDHLHYLVIGALANIVAVINAFTCYRLLVFKSRGPIVAEFVRFNIAQLFVVGCGLVALWLIVTFLHLSPLLGQALVTIGTILLSYIAHRRFSFAA
jgi:putative flippase GtrA